MTAIDKLNMRSVCILVIASTLAFCYALTVRAGAAALEGGTVSASGNPLMDLLAAIAKKSDVTEVCIVFCDRIPEQKFTLTNPLHVRWVIQGLAASASSGPAPEKFNEHGKIVVTVGKTAFVIPIDVDSAKYQVVSAGPYHAEIDRPFKALLDIWFARLEASFQMSTSPSKAALSDGGRPPGLNEAAQLHCSEASSMAVEAFAVNLPVEGDALRGFLNEYVGMWKRGFGQPSEQQEEDIKSQVEDWYWSWAGDLEALGRYVEAREVLDAAVKVFERGGTLRNGVPWSVRIKELGLNRLAESYSAHGKYDDAIATYEELKGVFQTETTKAGYQDLALYLAVPARIGDCLLAQGKNAEARAIYESILASWAPGGDKEQAARKGGEGKELDRELDEVRKAMDKLAHQEHETQH